MFLLRDMYPTVLSAFNESAGHCRFSSVICWHRTHFFQSVGLSHLLSAMLFDLDDRENIISGCVCVFVFMCEAFLCLNGIVPEPT